MIKYLMLTLVCFTMAHGACFAQTPGASGSRTPLFELPRLGGPASEAPPVGVETPFEPAASEHSDALYIPAPSPVAPTAPTTPIEPVCRLHLVGHGEIRSGSVVLAQPGEMLVFEAMTLSLEVAPSEFPATQFEGLGSGAARYTMRSVREWTVETSAGAVGASATGLLAWIAPVTPGWQTLEFEIESYATAMDAGGLEGMVAEPGGPVRVSVPVAVQYPMNDVDRGVLEGYPIGLYPTETEINENAYVSRFRKYYDLPEWLIKVTPETAGLAVGEHFRLGDFSPSAERSHMHFIALNPDLVRFLESLQDRVIERFGPDAKLRILRAYLSPAERRRLERQNIIYTTFARYQYGDAAAIVVSMGDDRGMADLDGNGIVNVADAEILAGMVESLQLEMRLPGGVGVVREPIEPDWPRTPFVLMDLRGIQTRW